MKLFLETKLMTLEDGEHEFILRVSNKEFYGYDLSIELEDNNEFIQDTLEITYKKDKDGKDTEEIENKIFKIREEETWWSFPKFEIVDGKIIPFEWGKYSYFLGTDRRMALASKINELYNPPSEAKILRKTFKYIMDTLGIEYPDDFKKYNDKIEAVIKKNPKRKN